MATWATARSPSCGGQHELDARPARPTSLGSSTADADARQPALLGRPARGPLHAPALRRVRPGAALSAAGLPTLLLDGEPVGRGAARRQDSHLARVPPCLPLLLQAGGGL